MNITDFLRARLDEDEQTARGAEAPQWVSYEQDCDVHVGGRPDGPHVALLGRSSWEGVVGNAAHIARHDPARVLREVKAKRRVIGRLNSHAAVMGEDEMHRDVLSILAAVYADHPDYNPDWRP